jgi:myo-inositol-1(or 4)-monophosphatase
MHAELLELAVDVAEAAGRSLLAAQHGRLEVRAKTSATDPVSEADTAAERLIVGRLLDVRPDDGILGEEDAGNRRGTSGIGWVIDPLDGTVNYLYGIPQWCVSVAAEDDAGTLVGVVHDPNRRETFAAARGHGATRDGHAPLRVTDVADLSHTMVATGFSYDPDTRADQGRMAARLVATCRDIRRAGSAALDLAWTAAGRIDAYLEFGLNPWDWAAGALLVSEAGGRVAGAHAHLGGHDRSGLVAGGAPAVAGLLDWLGGQAF